MARVRGKVLAWVLCLMAAAGAGQPAAASDDVRGVGAAVRRLGADAPAGKQWLVLIAVDRYREWPPLRHPVEDAREIRDILLSRYCFDRDAVVELFDGQATKKGILEAFSRLQAGVKPEDSVLIFYAGHGCLDRETDTGFWIPVDGGRDRTEQANWLPNVQVRGFVKRLEARHVGLIVDSCFSGDILNTLRGQLPEITDTYFRRAYEGVSRQALTSGASEAVPDESEFALQLKLALKGNRKPYLDLLQLFTQVRTGVGQTQPMLGDFKESGHQEGAGFLLFRQEEPPPEAVLSREQATLEALRRQTGEVSGRCGGASRNREDLAREAYREATRLNTEAAWHSVAANFSGTKWGELAKDRLFELEQARKAFEVLRADKSEEEAARREKEASIGRVWEQTRRADTKEAYRAFVARYLPEVLASSQVAQAQGRLEELARQASLRPTAGPDVTAISASPPTGMTNSLGMTFVRIPAGNFTMGSPAEETGRDPDETQHRVTISREFELQTTEVTQSQWEAVMGANPSYHKNAGSDAPVEEVSWDDILVFLRKLNERDPGKNYRLPTEAEWEYACRAGTAGDRYGELGSIAWYVDNSGGRAHSVGQKQANAWGLYDMLGNVWEWCADWSGDYSSNAVTDPCGPSSGSLRVRRGGCWGIRASLCRSASRGRFAPGRRSSNLGFRLARGQ